MEKIILNRIARPEELHVFKPRHGAQGTNLDVLRQACAESVYIDFNGVPPFGLYKQLVRVFVAEPLDFVFDARAVPGT